MERKERKMEKEQALVRRITNDMQIAHYVRQMEMAHSHGKKHRGAFSTGVYRIRSLRFVEAGLRRALWYLGKAVANHKLLFVMLPLIFVSASLIGPLLHRQKMTVSMPFTVIGGYGNDVISNGYSIQRTQRDFNYSNPAFTALNFLDASTYAVLLKTMVSRDTILRKDAVLAYSALKKRLDNFPVGNREFIETCPAECEVEKEMVDKIVKKSPQVALTYPETFVSMSKDSTNLSVETDSDGAISRAQALMLSFKLKDTITTEQNAAWAENFIEQTLSLTGSPADDAPSRLQLVSTLGYLQTQCALSRSKNCSSEHVHNIMSQCEERMKPRAGYPQFDRHRLLRIKLDTSKKLLLYSETDKERECLIVRSTLSEIYTLHHSHCYHSLVTRCLCEQLRLEALCQIRCDRLEPTSPNQNKLAWDEWRDARLISSLQTSSTVEMVLVFCVAFYLIR
ncbi:unnamed protein product [Heligmosomoides polygyrus]|uniref:Uncharacterized protein n=1 Tax=Heligmosomoides polygyrus TaxID=6339 RepID=A0A3P8BU15_HELPZ|nr:unnamed protein product [Heligmosomoides polygyrus]